QLDLSTPHPLPGPDAPLYHNLLAPTQWPSAKYLPDFHPVYEDYMARMGELSTFFTSLIAEAIGLPPDAFSRFFDPNQQHKLKIVKYPEAAPTSSLTSLSTPKSTTTTTSSSRSHDSTDEEEAAAEEEEEEVDAEDALARQGVGPHKDSMLTSYLLQASPHRGLQAQNHTGRWISVPPRPNTLVVAIGQGMEALTGGVCASTTHRVLSSRAGEGARYSVPFFQGVSYDARFEEMLFRTRCAG
ncbi:hypothetical protein LTS18_007750, partial [Coniosporium uncinatum]